MKCTVLTRSANSPFSTHLPLRLGLEAENVSRSYLHEGNYRILYVRLFSRSLMIHLELGDFSVLHLPPGSAESVTENPEETYAEAECSAHKFTYCDSLISWI